MYELNEVLSGIAINLASSLMVAGGRRGRDEALGDAQERAIEKVFGDATSVLLVEMARHDRGDRDLPDRLAKEFGKFYGDRWVAETLVGVALSKEEPAFEKLRRRFEEVGGNASSLPMDFGTALEILVYELADRLRKEASRAGSPLNNLVQVSELGAIREDLQELVCALKRDDAGVVGPDPGDGRFARYESGPEGATHDVLFAGFFLPAGPDGRFTSGGASRAFERGFLEVFRRELADHRLNTSGIEIEGIDLPVRVLDYRPPEGYSAAHDHDSFSDFTTRLAEGALGVVWATLREGGGLETLEIVLNPDRFYGGPKTLVAVGSVKRLADRDELPSKARAAFAALALAAMWAQSYCTLLDDRGMHRESYQVAADSRRLIERALEDLRTAVGPAHAEAVEEARRELLPQLIRQEATSLWREGALEESLERLLDALKVWPYGPLSGRAQFREFYEANHAFSFAQHFESWEQFLAENYETPPSFARRDLASQFAGRALVGLPSPDIVIFVGRIQEALGRGVDLEENVERWFSELAAVHPGDPFVLAYWGEARRVVAVRKYGAGFGEPVVAPVDRAREKFEEALGAAPELKVFAARIQGLYAVTAAGLPAIDAGEAGRRMDQWVRWHDKAKPFYREHAPWLLEGRAEDTPERIGRWVGERHGEGHGERGGGA